MELLSEVVLRPHAKGHPVCSECQCRRPGYDTLSERRFEFVPMWDIKVFFLHALHRVECGSCGVKVEAVPWARGKSPLTTTYAWFLARWTKRLSWKKAAGAFHTSWHSVVRSVNMAVVWGSEHRNLNGVSAIGIDEIVRGRGQEYAPLVYQIDAGAKRLLWVGRDCTEKTLLRFFDWFRDKHNAALRFVCTDMWRPHLRIIARKAAQAVHLLDRFHMMSHMSKAIDEVRAKEVKELKAKGKNPVLTGTRWCLLKRPENLTEGQEIKLKELLNCNLRTLRAYLLKEDFQWFWQYIPPAWAGKFLDASRKRTMRS